MNIAERRSPLEIEQSWFDMEDLKRPRISTASWIPLRASQVMRQGELWHPGCVDEYFGAISVIMSVENRNRAMEISWNDVNKDHHGPWVEGEQYFPSGIFIDYGSDARGNFSVLMQRQAEVGEMEWLLDQDIVLALELIREGDSWICPNEDFEEIARLRRTEDGRPVLLEIRAEQFRDYLCARSSGLAVITYRSRRAVFDYRPQLTWDSDSFSRDLDHGQWQGFAQDIDDSGFSSGNSEDVNTMVSGELSRNEWVEPASRSPRIRRDEVESTVGFILESDGTTGTGSEFRSSIRWLWFRPQVVLEVMRRRGGSLVWSTADTGAIGLSSHSPLHFGINPLGLINIFAKDIAFIPERVQKLWASQNVTPDGGVSRELFASQMEVNPARTVAPEQRFAEALKSVDENAKQAFGSPLFRPHASEEEILTQVNRFQCVEPSGLYRLCKEITRMVADRVDIGLLQTLQPAADKKLRSLKLIETLLSSGGLDGRTIVGPLFGAFELRTADAHLPPSDLEDALNLLGVNDTMNDVQKGKVIIQTASQSLEAIASHIDSLS